MMRPVGKEEAVNLRSSNWREQLKGFSVPFGVQSIGQQTLCLLGDPHLQMQWDIM